MVEEYDYFDIITGMGGVLSEYCNVSEEQILKLIVRQSWKVSLQKNGFKGKNLKNATEQQIERGMVLFKSHGTFKDYTDLVDRVVKDVVFFGASHEDIPKIRRKLLAVVRKHSSG